MCTGTHLHTVGAIKKMKNIPQSLHKIIGKWKLVDWENQIISHHPDDYPLDLMKNWKGFSRKNLDDFYQQIGEVQDWKTLNLKDEFLSNFSSVAIGEENLIHNKISDIEIEFTSKPKSNYSIYDFIVILKNNTLNNFYWEICNDRSYCDIDILTIEVYHYVKLKIIEMNENELVLLEIIDDESVTHFQKLTFERVDQSEKINRKIVSFRI